MKIMDSFCIIFKYMEMNEKDGMTFELASGLHLTELW